MAKKFKFSLENILKYRKSLQDNKMLKLHNSKIALKSEEEKLEDFHNLKSETLENGKTSDAQNINLLNRRIYDEYVAQINNDILKQKKVVRKSKKNLLQATEELNEETKQKKILEKLKEKHYDEFTLKRKRKEEKDNSEMALRKSFFNNQ